MVEPGILAGALRSLEVVHTHCTNLTKIQIEFLLNTCQQEGKLRELNISGNNLTKIDQNLKSRTYKLNFVQMILSPWFDTDGVKGWWWYQ